MPLRPRFALLSALMGFALIVPAAAQNPPREAQLGPRPFYLVDKMKDGPLKQKLAQLPVAKKVVVLEEKPSTVTVRVYPKSPGAEVAWTIANLSHTEKWTLEELHTEEGRLDEVFRSITMPDTAANDKKSASSEEKTSD